MLRVVAPADSGLQAVMVRIFGDKSEMYIDRDREIKILLRLNAAGFGAKACPFLSTSATRWSALAAC